MQIGRGCLIPHQALNLDNKIGGQRDARIPLTEWVLATEQWWVGGSKWFYLTFYPRELIKYRYKKQIRTCCVDISLFLKTFLFYDKWIEAEWYCITSRRRNKARVETQREESFVSSPNVKCSTIPWLDR